MRRTSSPLRTTVTLDIQSPLAERSDANIASAEAQDPARGKRNLPQSELRRTGSPLRHLPQELVRKGNSTSLTRSPTGNTSTSSLPQPKPDKENQPTFAAPATVEGNNPATTFGGVREDTGGRDGPSPQTAHAERTYSSPMTPTYSPMQISPLPSSWPLQPLNSSGNRRPSTAELSNAAKADSCDRGASRASAGSAEQQSRLFDSTAALEVLADCAAAEAATSRKAKGADSLHVRDLLRSSVRQAASTAAQKTSAQSPRGSTLMWSLLRTSLKQQGEVLLDLQSVKTAAKEAHREVRAREKVAAEQMQKAQTIARDARTFVKRQAAAYEQQKTRLAQKMEDVRDREKELSEQAEAQRQAAAEVAEARAKATQAQEALSEVLAARRGAREALGEMAAQNARLVVGYCAKKAELKRLQEGLAAERSRWEARLERLESGLYTGASGCSGKAYLPTQDAETPASKGGRAAPMSLRRRSEDQESAWKLERERVYRDKAALQRECKALLERLKEYEAADTRQSDAGATPVLQGRVLDFGGSPSLDADRVFSHGAAAAELQANDSTAQQDRIAEIEAQIERLTAENARLKQQQAEAEARSTAAERSRQAEERKQAGNALFQRGQHSAAVEQYSAALGLAQPDQAHLRAVLHCNRAAALHALRQHVDALADCFAAEAADPDYLRVPQRRADIHTAIGDHHSAMQDLARLMDRGVPDAQQKLAAAQRLAKLETEPDHYAVLGVQNTATPADIKQAFRQLALKYHPDKASNPGQRAASDKLFKLISNAHSVLADRDQRRMFDLTMLRRQMHAKGRHAT